MPILYHPPGTRALTMPDARTATSQTRMRTQAQEAA